MPRSEHPQIVIVGAGMSGLLVASMLREVPAGVLVLDQAMAPPRNREFPGILSRSDLNVAGLNLIPHAALPVGQVSHTNLDIASSWTRRNPHQWFAIDHGHLLDALKASLEASGTSVVPNATVAGFLWDQGVVSGVRLDDGGMYSANLVVLADESSPRLPESFGLRPDWSPLELMHIGKRRNAADAAVVHERLGIEGNGYHITSFTGAASWGSPGWGIVIPAHDSITVSVAMTLEEAMVSTRHISEYLDEIERHPIVRDIITGLSPDSNVTEVVPIGGFDSRNTFHGDGILVVNDLVGVTHPLNRDGMSANLAVCQAASRVISNAVASDDYRSMSLRQYSASIVDDVVSYVDAARRQDKALRARPPWQWAVKPDLFPAIEGVTTGPKSATLSGVSETGVWKRLRGFGRIPGVRRHAPGEYDE